MLLIYGVLSLIWLFGGFLVGSSQQPARFSNRCLQTIGRCWPYLRALGVGGAGCGIQGLASLGKRSTILWLYFYSGLIYNTLRWNTKS